MAKSRLLDNEADALVGLCAVYERVLGVQYVVGCKPDRPRPGVSRMAKAPDCLVSTENGGQLAIEHTGFLTLDGQAKFESEFARVREGLRLPDEVEGALQLDVRLQGLALPRELRADLTEWLSTAAAALPRPGHIEVVLRRSRLRVTAARSESSRGRRLLVRALLVPGKGWNIKAEAGRLGDTLREAAEKFESTPGARRAVLLHSDDFVNLGDDTVEGWLQDALTEDLRSKLDDIWWLNTDPGKPVIHFYRAWWSRRCDAVSTVLSAEWTAEGGHRRDVMEWPADRPWWRAPASE